MLNKFVYILLAFSVWACTSKEDSQEVQSNLLTYPSYFGEPNLNLDKNPISKEGIALGEKLFFDPILSGNNNISCASCHLPKLAFSDGIAQSTLGDNGELLIRNSPALFNLAWHDNYFWDGGSNDLESQTLGPIMSESEMGQDLTSLLPELKTHSEYPDLFKKVFNDQITLNYVMFALAQYERSLISFESKYDAYVQGKVAYSEAELNGFQVFTQNCASCHSLGHFSDFDFHNNGLDTEFNFTSTEDQRWGRYRITMDVKDVGKYKTPSLRNIELTAPYMHDGRFLSLEDVIEHYSNGIKNSNTLDSLLPRKGFQFSAQEKGDLIQFLNTLTDENFISRYK